jgi:hypothetical protein
MTFVRFLLPDEFLWAVEEVRNQLYDQTYRDFREHDCDTGPRHVFEAMAVMDEYLAQMGRVRKEVGCN